MLYEELKGCKKNALQERLCLVVHIRRQSLEAQRLEILAMASATAETHKAVVATLDAYRRAVFGKVETEKDRFLEDSKKLLAEEAKKVYLVKPVGKGAKEHLHAQSLSSNPGVAQMAQAALREERKAAARLVKSRGSFVLPKGTVREG